MKSENISDLATALAKAQSEMKDAVLSKVNPHFKNKYADLPAVREAITAPLTKNGIAVTQTMDADENGRSYIVTTLMHTSGQWISGRTPILVEKTTMQALGSGITYARRYALAAICGIASDEDDDGNGAGDPKITEAQLELLRRRLDASNSDVPNFCKYMKVDSLPNITQSKLKMAHDALDAKEAPKK